MSSDGHLLKAARSLSPATNNTPTPSPSGQQTPQPKKLPSSSTSTRSKKKVTFDLYDDQWTDLLKIKGKLLSQGINKSSVALIRDAVDEFIDRHLVSSS